MLKKLVNAVIDGGGESKKNAKMARKWVSHTSDTDHDGVYYFEIIV